jgi:hypothetical protein
MSVVLPSKLIIGKNTSRISPLDDLVAIPVAVIFILLL